jgi:hypothetical protein
MASATGIPPNVAAARGQSEEEPLLGRRGDASQTSGQALYHNLWIGTYRQVARRMDKKEEMLTEPQAPLLLRKQAYGL